jgi:hypothetical protein
VPPGATGCAFVAAVLDVAEVNGEAGPFYEVAVERGGERRTLLVGPGKAIVGERR